MHAPPLVMPRGCARLPLACCNGSCYKTWTDAKKSASCAAADRLCRISSAARIPRVGFALSAHSPVPTECAKHEGVAYIASVAEEFCPQCRSMIEARRWARAAQVHWSAEMWCWLACRCPGQVSRPPPSCAHRPVSLVRRARPTATTCNCRRCSFTRSGAVLHLLMQRQWPCKFLVLAALSGMWGVPRTHWLAQLLAVEEEMSNSFEAFDAPCRRH